MFEESKDEDGTQRYFLHEFWRPMHGDILWRKRQMSVVRATLEIEFNSCLTDEQLCIIQELWRADVVSAAAKESGIVCTRGPFCQSPVATQYTIAIAATSPDTKWSLEKVRAARKQLVLYLTHGNTFPGFVNVVTDADQQNQVQLTEKAIVKVKCAFPFSNEQLTSVHNAWFNALHATEGDDSETPAAPACDHSLISTEYCIQAILRTCTHSLDADVNGDSKIKQFEQRLTSGLVKVSGSVGLPSTEKAVVTEELVEPDLAISDWKPVLHVASANATEHVQRVCRRCGMQESFLALSRLKGSCVACESLEFRERLLVRLGLTLANSTEENDDLHQIMCERTQADILSRWQRKWVPMHTSMRILEPLQQSPGKAQLRLCCAADLEDDDDDQQMRW